jgi:deoxyribose-phosphate aldolase
MASSTGDGPRNASQASDDAGRRHRDAGRVIALLDLTDLDNHHRPDGIDTLVHRAVAHRTAAICVWPEFVRPVRELLAEAALSAVDGYHHVTRIATVVNFPAGDSTIGAVRAETRLALADGADEIDLVLPYRALLAGDVDRPTAMVSAIAEVVHGQDRHVKVILETGELVDLEVVRAASRLAIECGADFIKTSTGKTPTSATLDAVEVMIDMIIDTGGTVGLKPSGGIRTVVDAIGYLDLVDRKLGATWATPETFRFGASSLLDDALDVLSGRL